MHLDDFLAELRRARRDGDLTAARALVGEAVQDEPMAAEIGDPHTSQLLYTESGLLVLHVVVLPGYATAPHDHRTWSVVGVYEGQEDNAFYQRLPRSSQIAQTGGKRLEAREVLMLDESAIHSIGNPRPRPLMALHIYGANIFALERSAWSFETGHEERYDFERHAGGPGLKRDAPNLDAASVVGAQTAEASE